MKIYIKLIIILIAFFCCSEIEVLEPTVDNIEAKNNGKKGNPPGQEKKNNPPDNPEDSTDTEDPTPPPEPADSTGFVWWDWSKFTVPDFTGNHTNFAVPELTIDVHHDTEGVQTVGDRIRFYVDPLSPQVNGFNYRSEFRTRPWQIAHPLGTEQWVGFSYTLADNYVPQPSGGTPISIWQNKQPDGGGPNSPALQLELTKEGQLNGVPPQRYRSLTILLDTGRSWFSSVGR